MGANGDGAAALWGRPASDMVALSSLAAGRPCAYASARHRRDGACVANIRTVAAASPEWVDSRRRTPAGRPLPEWRGHGPRPAPRHESTTDAQLIGCATAW